MESQLFIMELTRELNRICQVKSSPLFLFIVTLCSKRCSFVSHCALRDPTSSHTSGQVRTSGRPMSVGTSSWTGLLCWRKEFRYVLQPEAWIQGGVFTGQPETFPCVTQNKIMPFEYQYEKPEKRDWKGHLLCMLESEGEYDMGPHKRVIMDWTREIKSRAQVNMWCRVVSQG